MEGLAQNSPKPHQAMRRELFEIETSTTENRHESGTDPEGRQQRVSDDL